MNCEHLNEQLWDYLYGLLDEAEAQPLRDHLAGCPHCQEELRIAEVQQKLLARAAHVIRDVPPFVLPDETAPAPAVQPAAVQAAVLPLSTSVARRSPVRRWWPAWSAAAAILVAALFGQQAYQRGLEERRNAVSSAHRHLAEINGQLAALQKTFESDLKVQAQTVKKQQLHVEVAGQSQMHPDVGSTFDIRAENLEGEPQKTEVCTQLVEEQTNKVVFEEKQTIAGQWRVAVPTQLKGLPANPKLVVTCQNEWGAAQITESLAKAAPDYVNHIALNKAIYTGNELAFFRTLTLERYSLKPPTQPIDLRFTLKNEQGKVVTERIGQTGPGGISGGEFALANDLANGEYTLHVAAVDPTKFAVQPQTRRLEILRETGPIVQIDRDRLAGGLRAGQTANVPITVTRPDGRPAANAAVTANMYTSPQYGGSPAPFYAPGAVNKGTTTQQAYNQQLRLNEQGQAMLRFQVPPKLTTNNAILEVELSEEKDKRKAIQNIPLVPSQLGIDFFPEGGDLIAGVPNQVYYRVRTAQGDPINPEGRVLLFSTNDVLLDSEPGQPSGTFTFVPDAKQTYSARITGPDGLTEIANPFQRPGIKTSGVVLHVPQPVTHGAEPLAVTLHNAGEARTLLVLAACRGQIVGHQSVTVSAKSADLKLAVPASAQGIVRLTVYEAAARHLNPLAERLVFRIPTAKLDVNVEQLRGKEPYNPSQSAVLGLKIANEKGESNGAWYLASVADERFQGERRERPLGVHFHLATELNTPEDLDQAHVGLIDTPENRQALDLFLGTQGWRRFTSEVAPQVALDTDKTEGSRGGASAPLYFVRENSSLADLRANAQVRYEIAAADLREKADAQQRDLADAKSVHLRQAETAAADLLAYEQLPHEWFRLGLGGLALALLSAGVLLMLWSVVKTLTRMGDATPALGGAFACLALCLILHLSARQFVEVEQRGPKDTLAQLGMNGRPWGGIDAGHVLTWSASPRPAIGTGHFAADPKRAVVAAKEAEGKTEGGAGVRSKTGNAGDKNYADVLASVPNYSYAATEAELKNSLNEELTRRFTAANVDDQTARAEAAKKKDAKSSTDPSATGKKGAFTYRTLAKEYVHARQEKAFDRQDTVLWFPALYTASGADEVAFHLSQNLTTYRVLIFANSPEGRLGFYEGRLDVREAKRR